tara:strand:+ start:108 stop:944 length:837 start_codon:yes stop_codon:yes gene_type:complete
MLYPEINPIFISLGPLELHWYGLMYVLGFLFAWKLALIKVKNESFFISENQVDELIFYGALGVIIGGRLGYIFFYGFDAWLKDPIILLRIWEGGMSFHGGLIGVIIAVVIFSYKQKLRFWPVMDLVAVITPVGLFTGRLGNFINGELWGSPSNLPWAMKVGCAERADLCLNKLNLTLEDKFTPALHPTQLYEAFFEGLILFIILWIYSSKPRVISSISSLFLIGYSFFRFFIEFLRIPDSHLGYFAFNWLTLGQILCIPMFIAGIVLYWQSKNMKIEK